MAEKFDDDMLEDLFASAKSDARMAPSPDLLARVLESAEVEQAAQQAAKAAPKPAPSEDGGFWRGLWLMLGGWPSISGVAMAGAAGVWIGVSSGTALMQDTLGLDIYGQSAQTYLSDLDATYAFGLDLEE